MNQTPKPILLRYETIREILGPIRKLVKQGILNIFNLKILKVI
jgi:hypothetical protein